MACLIYEGVALDCNDGKSGAVDLWVTEFASVSSFTETSGTITALTQAASTKFWRIQVSQENLQFTQATAGSNNLPYGTTQQIVFTVLKPTAKLRNWLKTIAKNKLVFLIKDANDTYQMMGINRGAYLEKNDTTSGKMINDFSGYTFTFTAKEPDEAPFVQSSVVSGLSYGA